MNDAFNNLLELILGLLSVLSLVLLVVVVLAVIWMLIQQRL